MEKVSFSEVPIAGNSFCKKQFEIYLIILVFAKM